MLNRTPRPVDVDGGLAQPRDSCRAHATDPVQEIASALTGQRTTVGDRSVMPGDDTDDGAVDFADLNAVLSDFGGVGAGQFGDVNADGVVDFSDLNEVLSNFGV
jgi:hypothetical protein